VQYVLDQPRADVGPERMRRSRGMEVLEGMATAEACRLLEEIAKGAPGAALTEDSKAALERVNKRTVKR
jgi:hypothetical protein